MRIAWHGHAPKLLQAYAPRIAEGQYDIHLQEKGGETVMGAVSLECSPAAGPTKFMIGTEQGPILSCNRKAKTPADRVTGYYPGEFTRLW